MAKKKEKKGGKTKAEKVKGIEESDKSSKKNLRFKEKTPQQKPIIGPLKETQKTKTMTAQKKEAAKPRGVISPAAIPIEEEGIPENRKIVLVIVIVFLALVILSIVLYFIFAKPSPDSTTDDGYISENDSLVSQFSEDYINHLIFALDGWKLHASSSSGSTPKIEIVADGEVYVTEIIDMEVSTKKKRVDNEDIAIITTKMEIINSILSPNIKEYIRNSYNEGKTNVVVKASYSILTSKGYSSFYKELTGKSLTATN